MKITRLTEVRNERKRADAKELRGEMYRHVGNCIKQMADDIAGYAVVMWDKDGYNYSTLRAGGPIRSRLIPSFARDALNQHVTVDLVEDK